MRPDLLLLFERPYWLDEWHTMLVANRPSVLDVVADLRNGSDFAPPFLHVTLWTLRAVVGGTLDPWMTRVFAVVCTALALCFVFLALRRRLGRSASAAGMLAVATNAMVVAYAFETRFYAPWLMFAAMFAWSLSVDAPEERSRRRTALTAMAAVGLCTTHWFGVVTLGLMCVAAAATGWRSALRRIAPAAAGVVALVLCLPLLVGQRGSIREKSWIADLEFSQFARLADTFWLALVPLVAIAVIALALAVRRWRGRAREALSAARDPSLLALSGLTLMPVALVVLSLLQPVMLDRYALTAMLAWAPLVGIAAHLLPRSARLVVLGVFVVAGLRSVGGQVGIERQVAQTVAIDERLLRQACASETVAFFNRGHLYHHLETARDACPRAYYLELSPQQLARLFTGPNARMQRFHRSEAEFARLHAGRYGFPRVLQPAALDSLDHFVVMVQLSGVPRDRDGREFFSPLVFPRHRATQLNGNAILYERIR